MSKPGDWLVDPLKYFKKYDTNGDGKLSTEEVRFALQSLGFNPTDKEMKDLMNKADTNKSGFIEYNNNEFTKLLSLLEDDSTHEKLLKVFQRLDLNGDGTISADELRKFLSKTKLSQDVIENIIRQADQDGNGTIDYEEFIALSYQSPTLMQ